MFLTKAKTAIKAVATKISVSVKRTITRKDKPQKLVRVGRISHNIDQVILETTISESATAWTDGSVMPNIDVIDKPGVNASQTVNSTSNSNSTAIGDCNCNCNCSCNGNCNGNCACNDYDSNSDCDCSDCESICSGDYSPYSDGNKFFCAGNDFYSDIICSGGYNIFSGRNNIDSEVFSEIYSDSDYTDSIFSGGNDIGSNNDNGIICIGGYSNIDCSAGYNIFSGRNNIDSEVFSEIYSDSDYTDSICSGGNNTCSNNASNTTTISAASTFKAFAKRAFKSKDKGNSDNATGSASNTIKSFIERVRAFSSNFIERAHGHGRTFF
ncbi:hypothetical protein IWW56_001253 [Coemansia sp. RSA 2131]|nr:hypothetical protein IWW56_001253 [Coemansia sp. RSA 2131]